MNYYERVAKTVGLTLLLVTLVGTAVALLVMAPDAFFLIFLAVLFAVLLARTAAYLQRWLPLGYSWSLAVVVLLLLAGTVAGGVLLGSAVQQQVQRTSNQLDEASVNVEKWLRNHPTVRQAILEVPGLGRAVEQLIDQQDQQSKEGSAQSPAPQNPATSRKADGPADNAEPGQEGSDNAAVTPSTAEKAVESEASEENVEADNGRSAQTASSDSKASSPKELFDSNDESQGTPSVPGHALNAVGQIFSTTFGALTSLAIVIFVGLFLAADPQLYRRGLLGLFPPASQARAAQLLKRLDHVLFHWLIGTMMTMVITGIGTGLGLWFLGVPLAGTVGTVTALLAFIPNLGALLALLLAMLVASTQGATTVMWVVGLYLLLQLVESNVVTPLIQQQQTSLPPALLIAFQLLVGMLTGFLGLMVATPLLAAITVIIDELWYTEPSDVL